jgi:hypothetical protein
MKKFTTKLAIAGLGLLLLQTQAYATTQTGLQKVIRISTDTLAKGNTARLNIEMFNLNACNNYWYGLDKADTGVGYNIFRVALLAAQAGNTVTIYGNGICDSQGIEGIQSIDFDTGSRIIQ